MTDDLWHGPRRLGVAEWMDAPAVGAAELRSALRFIRGVNRWLGYTKITVGHLARLTADRPADRPLTVLDVATGSADVPAAVLAWAKRQRRDVRVVGLDLNEGTLAAAADFVGPAVPLVRGDALALPFADGAFDVVMTSMFLHHLPDDAAAGVLREMDRVAGVAVIAADLLRERAAYRWIRLFTAWSSPMVKHDGRVSVLQAFTMPEADALRQAAGLDYAAVRRHAGHRFVIAGAEVGPLSRHTRWERVGVRASGDGRLLSTRPHPYPLP